jgi:hypothetical protein
MFNEESRFGGNCRLLDEVVMQMDNDHPYNSPFHVSSFVPRDRALLNIIVDRNNQLLKNNPDDRHVLKPILQHEDPKHVEETFIKNYTMLLSRRAYRRFYYIVKFGIYVHGYFFKYPYALWIQTYIDTFSTNIMDDAVSIIMEYYTPKDVTFNCSRVLTKKPNVTIKACKSMAEKLIQMLKNEFGTGISMILSCVEAMLSNMFESGSADESDDSANANYMLDGDVPTGQPSIFRTSVACMGIACEKAIKTAKPAAKPTSRSGRRVRSPTPMQEPTFDDCVSDTNTPETSTPIHKVNSDNNSISSSVSENKSCRIHGTATDSNAQDSVFNMD